MKRQNRTRIDLHGLRRLTTLVVLALWLLAACSSDGDDEAATASSTESASETADEPTQADEADGGATDDAEPVAETEPELDEPCNADPTVLTTDGGIDFVRTPDACFAELPGWSYEPSYVEIDGLRQAYVDEGPADGEVILLLHGQPSWSYLYRDMIPVFAEAGYRVIAMDHLGMGRSDKPTEIESYSYLGHGERLETFIAELGLTDINLFVQDWGSLIGLRVAGENTELFSTITVGNGNLPVVPEGAIPLAPVENPEQINDLESPFADIPEQQFPFYDGCELIQPDESIFFGDWMVYSMTAEGYTASSVVEALTWFDLAPEVEAAYDAPFPSREYMAGTRVFPSLVLEIDGVNDEAWAGLQSFDRPFLTLWASNDAGTLGACETQQNLIDNIPGAEGQPHDRLPEASHFLQSDQGEEIATRMVDWLAGLDAEDEDGVESASPLLNHDAYWVTEVELPNLTDPMTVINDMYVDLDTMRVTVYAQARVPGEVISPPQVGPGECTETSSGERVCHHPNAVYLNGSGDELDASDGTGEWWVKHSWVLGGEGYDNCELLPAAESYDDCFWVEGDVLDDGITMQIGGIEPETEDFFNTRTPLLDSSPIEYELTRFEPAADGSGPTEAFVLNMRCEEATSAFDGSARTC